MRILTLIALGVLAVVLVHLVGGWVLSTRLYRGALRVQPRSKDLGVWVRNVEAGTIVLEAAEPRQDIGHPGVLGLAWENGYQRVGDVVNAANGTITRVWPRSGENPSVCEGSLDDCAPVELDSYAYPEDPDDVDLGFTEITYDSPLGPMGAWLVGPQTAGRWAILVHGWTAERRELVRMLPSFHRTGFASMVIDYRNDPGVPHDPSGRYRFGITEWEDLEAAVRYALDNGADDVTLMGCSTGGAIVMAFLERSPLADRVTGVVMDAPNIVLSETIRLASQESSATRLMSEFGMWIADLRWRIDWETTNYVQRADRILQVPTLVFHGTSDHTVPIAGSRQLAHRVPELVELVETPAAGHVMSWNADPERYDRYLETFLRRL